MTLKSPDSPSCVSPRVALFPGSFRPFTVGHASIVERALSIFDRVVVAFGVNVSKSSGPGDSFEKICNLYKQDPRVEVITFEGLAVDCARRVGACAILRGVRSVADFEYERNMADVNRRLSGIETVLLYSLPEHSAVSSSMVRELEAFGVDVAPFLPPLD